MATYVNNLRLTELATGEGSGTWGTTTNLNLKAISEGLGYNTVAISGDTTFTIPDGRTATATNNDKARSMYFAMTSSGSLSGTKVITFAPNTISRVMLIENATTGTAITQIKQGSGGTVNIPNGKTKLVYMDGAGTGAKVIDISPTLDLTGVSINGASSIAGTSLDINGNADISGDLTLSAGADGALRFSAASSIKILDNSSTSLVIEEADNAYITFDTTNTSEKIIFAKLAQFDSFKGTGSITVTDIKDEDDLGGGSSSATALATQQSIKAYVDAQIVRFDTLAEVLASGNTTGGTKISVDNTSGGIDLIDNAKIRLGTGNDLEIYHDGTNSIIREEVVSSGGLLVEADKLILRSHTSTEKYIEATKDGAVDLYHDNSKKLATTSSGIAVTGTLRATLGLEAGNGSSQQDITLIRDTSEDDGGSGGIIFQQGRTGSSAQDKQTKLRASNTTLTNRTLNLPDTSGILVASDGAGNVTITGDLTLSAGGDGALRFSAASSIKVIDNSATALVIEEADTAYMTFNTANIGGEKIEFGKSIDVTGIVTADRFSLTRTNESNVESLGIYTDSDNDTFIEERDLGNGSLKILGTALQLRADDLRLMNRAGTETYFEGDVNGEAKLFHDNSVKLATKAIGVAVTGTTTSDSMRVGQQVSPYNTSAKQSAFLLGLDGTDDADKKNAAAFKITSNTGAGATVIEDMVDNDGQNVVYAGRHQYFMTKESSGAPESALGSDLSDSATSLTTSSNISSTVTATATRPSPAILSDGSGGVNESVMVYGISGTTLTIARGMDGTTPRAFTTANSAKIKFVNYTPRLIFGNNFNDTRFINTSTGSTSPYTDDSQGNWNAISVFDIDSSGPLIPARGGSGAKLRFRELASNGTNTVTLIGPASTADITVTLPTSTGTLALTSDISSATAVGALNSGSITSGFGNIDNGSSTITTTGAITGGSLEINGTTTLNTGSTANGVLIDGTGGGTGLKIRTSETATLASPDLTFTRTGNRIVGGATNVGQIHFDAKNSNSGNSTFAEILGRAETYTEDDEDGVLLFRPSVDGTITTILEVDKTGIDVTGKIKGDSLDIDGNADISGDLTLSAGADGALRFSAASSIKVIDNSATALVIEEADTAYMTFVTTNGSEKVTFGKPINGALTGDVTGNTSGSSGSCTGNSATATLATTVTVSDNTANTNFPVVFNNESNALLDDTGALTYNPSTGTLKSPSVTSSPSLANGTSLITGNISSADFKSYAGQRIVYYGSGAGEFDLFDAAAADIGKTFVIVNASDDTITLDVDGGGTAQFVGVLTGSSNDGQNTNITIVTGGVAELVCVRGTGNGGSAAAPNFIIFGSGI